MLTSCLAFLYSNKLPVTQNELLIATRRDPKLSQVVRFTKYGPPSDVGIE